MAKIILRLVLQVVAVAAISAIFAYLAWAANFRSLLNDLGMFIVPSVVAILSNRNRWTQVSMALALSIMSALIWGIIGVVGGFY